MKRSALFYIHQLAGARFVETHGWELPASFGSGQQEVDQIIKSVGLVDLSHYLKFDLRTPPNQLSWRLGVNHYLLFVQPPFLPPAEAIDVTSVYASLRLVGPWSKDVLNKLTSLNLADAALPNLSCAQTNVAHVHTIVMREDIKELPAFHLLVGREYAEYFWDAIVHAGHEFQLCLFGLEALQALEPKREAVSNITLR